MNHGIDALRLENVENVQEMNVLRDKLEEIFGKNDSDLILNENLYFHYILLYKLNQNESRSLTQEILQNQI